MAKREFYDYTSDSWVSKEDFISGIFVMEEPDWYDKHEQQVVAVEHAGEFLPALYYHSKYVGKPNLFFDTIVRRQHKIMNMYGRMRPKYYDYDRDERLCRETFPELHWVRV